MPGLFGYGSNLGAYVAVPRGYRVSDYADHADEEDFAPLPALRSSRPATPVRKVHPEVAMHEAAHAVVATRLGYAVSVSIVADGTSLGRAIVDYNRPDLAAFDNDFGRAVIAYAGHFGELLEDPWRMRIGGSVDAKNAEAAVKDATMRGYAARDAERHVHENAEAVRAVANALRVHHQLSRADVAAIVARYAA